MDDEGKNLILRRLAGKKEDSLKVLKGNIKKPGYISEVKSVISELTQYNISPDGMDDMITEADESSYLAWKLKDIQVMYQAFEEYLADKYITKEEILDILCNVMDKSRMLKDSVIALDGFTGFTPLQNKVLGEMLHHCQKVMITVTMDKREDPYVMKDKYQLFALSKQMVTSLVKIAGEEKVLVEEPVCLYQEPVWRFRNAPALAFLEKELFRYSGRTYREKQSNVRVYAAANPRMEVECVAQRIRFLIRKKEYRYREIAVIASDMNLYADEIEKTFREYEIPVFMDYKRNVLLNSFVEYIRSLLAMAEQNFSAESVFRFLRTDLVGFTGEELDLLENYVLALGIRGYKKWQEKWIRRAKDTTEEELEVLNHLRVCFVEKTEDLVFVLKQRQKTVRDVTLAICEFLEKEEIQKQVKVLENQFTEAGELALAKEYAQIYRVVMELFDKFVSLLGDERIALKEYRELLDAGMEEARIGVIPPSLDEVMAGDIERTRLKDIRALILLGVNDSLIPGNASAGGLISDRDRERFEERGIALAPGTREKSYIQKFYLYLHMTKPTEELMLTYSKVSADGKSRRAAYLIGDLSAQLDQIIDGVLQLPDLAAGASAVGWRVHDNAVVAVAAANLTLDKLFAIVHNPADGLLLQAGQLGILPCPCYHALAGIDMADLCARLCAGKRCAAGVGEQVEDADLAACAANLVCHKVPVDRLLREKSGVLKAGRADFKAQVFVGNRPLLPRHIADFPLASAACRAQIPRVGAAPDLALRGVPDNLWVGSGQNDVSPALQLFPAGGVNYLKLFPVLCSPHCSLTFL